MKRIDNAVGDCKRGQFWQVRVWTERDEDCAVSLQISCRPYLQPVEKTRQTDVILTDRQMETMYNW